VVTHLACSLLMVLWLLLLAGRYLLMAQTATAYEHPCWKHLQQQQKQKAHRSSKHAEAGV
jgi:hypothetical protein